MAITAVHMQRARSVLAGRVQGVCTLLEEAARAVVGPVADGKLLPGLEGAPCAQRKGATAGRELGGGLGGMLAEVEEGHEGEGVVVIRHGEAATRHLVRVRVRVNGQG